MPEATVIELYGGKAEDWFRYLSITDSELDSSDTIFDFSHKQKDKIDLREVVSGKFQFIGEEAFSGEGKEVRYEQSSERTTLFVDFNRDGEIDMAIKFDDVIDLVAKDFLL